MAIDSRSFLMGVLAAWAVIGVAFLAIGLLWPGAGPLSLAAASPSSLGGPSGPSTHPILTADAPTSASSDNRVQPLFSPGSGDEIASLISNAQHSIDIEMYEMTDSSGLPQAMAAAQARGVSVRLILEPRVNSKTIPGMVAGLSASGVQVKWASLQYTLTHSKMMIVDGHLVLVGSINFSKAAQNTNREADAIMDGPVASQYEQVFMADWALASDARPATTDTSAGG